MEAPSVVSVKALQNKSRWLPEVPGYCSSGFRTRTRLRLKGAKWRERGEGVVHLTLTYDPWQWVQKPAGFDAMTPDEKSAVYASDAFQKGCNRCYLESRKRRHVGEFVRRLREEFGDFEWFCVVEFQGNGQVHYHVLINRPFLDHGKVWKLWRFGFCLLRPCVDSTLGYLTKYLTKGVDVPTWLLSFSSALRMTSTSRQFWDEIGGGRSRGDAAAGEGDRREGFPGGERVAAGLSAAVFGAGFDDAITQRRGVPPTIAEVRADPSKRVKVMLQCITSTGEQLHRSVKMNIYACMDALQRMGYAAFDFEDEGGSCRFAPAQGAVCLLDQLLHCGEAKPEGTPPPLQ